MRAIVVLLSLVCLAAGPVIAEEDSGVSFGIKGGINPAYQEWSPDPDNMDGMFIRYGAGVSLGFEMNPNVSLDTDFLYVMKGGKFRDEYRSGNELDHTPRVFESELSLDYIVINPMFRVTPKKVGPSPYFMAGPEVGFLMSAEWVSGAEGLGKTSHDAKDEFGSTDFGLTVGGGLQFPVQKTTLFFVEARYSHGFTDITTDPDMPDPESERGSIRNRGIYLFGGLRF